MLLQHTHAIISGKFIRIDFTKAYEGRWDRTPLISKLQLWVLWIRL